MTQREVAWSGWRNTGDSLGPGPRQPDAIPRYLWLRARCGQVAVGCAPTRTAEADFLGERATGATTRATRGRSNGCDRPRAGDRADDPAHHPPDDVVRVEAPPRDASDR